MKSLVANGMLSTYVHSRNITNWTWNPMGFFLNAAESSLNSVNLINHWSMNGVNLKFFLLPFYTKSCRSKYHFLQKKFCNFCRVYRFQLDKNSINKVACGYSKLTQQSDRHNLDLYPIMHIHNLKVAHEGSSIGYYAKRIRSERKCEDDIWVKISDGSRQAALLKLEIRSFETKTTQDWFLKLKPKPTFLYLAAKMLQPIFIK